MAKKKTAPKVKEFVRLREKNLANGNKSLYLDIYKNGNRSYEFLKMYLIPETTKENKLKNRETLQIANTIKAQKEKDILFSDNNMSNPDKGKMSLSELITIYATENKEHKKLYYITKRVKELIEIYNGTIKLKDIKKDYYFGFVTFLKGQQSRYKREFTPTTIWHYSNRLITILNFAVQREYIHSNPFNRIPPKDKVKKPESSREYLSIEELNKLIETPFPKAEYSTIKDTFLFACYVGLRISDIEELTWANIKENKGNLRIEKKQHKTKVFVSVKIGAKAKQYLPERGTAKEKDKVFVTYNRNILSYHLKAWAKAANIEKDLTFHMSRHTFATMMLTSGADLYTTSKLMGHTDIATTQIYAKIIDQKKDDAIDLLDSL